MPNTWNLTTRARIAATCLLLAAAAAPLSADALANCTGRSFTDAVNRLEVTIQAGDDGEALDLPLKLAVKFRQGAPQEYPLSKEQDFWFKPDVRAFQIKGIDLMPITKPSHYWFTGPRDCSYLQRDQLCAAVFHFDAHRVSVSSEPAGVNLDFEILSMGNDFIDQCISKAEWRIGRRGERLQLRLKDASGRLIWRQPAIIDVATLLQGGTVRVTRAQVEGEGSRATEAEVEVRAQAARVPTVEEIAVSLARPQR